MTDDLVGRLRTTRLLSQRNQLALQEEAAARIEALEGENRAVRNLLGDIEQSATAVHKRGAVTGPQWSRLGGDLIRTRAALAKDKSNG